MNTYSILVADMGATFSRFALFLVEDREDLPRLCLKREFWFSTKDAENFEDLLLKLSRLPSKSAIAGPDIRFAVLAPPGPVVDNVCRPPNIPWTISCKSIASVLGISRCYLVNDFVAQGYGCLYSKMLGQNILDLRCIRDGREVPGAPLAIVGAGTGFGKALMIENDSLIYASEGGHANFPFVGRGEFAYADFLSSSLCLTDIEYDEVLSGRGFAHLFAFHSGEYVSPEEATRRVTAIGDTPPYSQIAAELALEWFARFYGRACRNYFLETMALGGVIITGGMALRLPVLDHPAFMSSFLESSTQGTLLQRVPMWHIQSQQAGLWGAAFYGTQVSRQNAPS